MRVICSTFASVSRCFFWRCGAVLFVFFAVQTQRQGVDTLTVRGVREVSAAFFLEFMSLASMFAFLANSESVPRTGMYQRLLKQELAGFGTR